MIMCVIKQIHIIKKYLRGSKVYQQRRIKPEHFVERGVISSVEDMDNLETDIRRLIMLFKTRYTGIFDFKVMSKYTEEETEETLTDLILTLGSTMKRTAKNYLRETSRLRAEIVELQRLCDKRKKKV